MANQIVPNYTLAASGDTFSAVWKLTRGMKKSGYTYLASSDGTTTEVAGVATNDKWGGNADPLLDSYPALGAGAWILMAGPSTVKIPIDNLAPSGVFFRGEKVTQATSGAEGELLGIVTDGIGSAGYLVIAPRTGTFNGTNIITGAYSAATITPPASTVVKFVRQIVFWRNSITAGHAYYQCVDEVGEATSRFSDATRMAAVTAAIAPGGNNTGNNTFPAIGTMAMIGTGGSGAVGTGSKAWIHSDITASSEIGKVQIIVANNTPAADVSEDGSFVVAYGTPVLESGSFIGFGLCRLDDQEDGDLDPYVSFNPNMNTLYSGSRTAVVSAVTAAASFDVAKNFFVANACVANYATAKIGIGSTQNLSCWRGFRRRGLSGETFQEFIGQFLASFGSTEANPTVYNDALIFATTTSTEVVATAPVVSRVREPIWIASTQANQKMRKGTLRWWYYVQGGAGCDTFDGEKWIQLGSARNTQNTYWRGPVVVGPWDETTTPTNA